MIIRHTLVFTRIYSSPCSLSRSADQSRRVFPEITSELDGENSEIGPGLDGVRWVKMITRIIHLIMSFIWRCALVFWSPSSLKQSNIALYCALKVGVMNMIKSKRQTHEFYLLEHFIQHCVACWYSCANTTTMEHKALRN